MLPMARATLKSASENPSLAAGRGMGGKKFEQKETKRTKEERRGKSSTGSPASISSPCLSSFPSFPSVQNAVSIDKHNPVVIHQIRLDHFRCHDAAPRSIQKHDA